MRPGRPSLSAERPSALEAKVGQVLFCGAAPVHSATAHKGGSAKGWGNERELWTCCRGGAEARTPGAAEQQGVGESSIADERVSSVGFVFMFLS